MPALSRDSEIELMLLLLSEAYEKKTWHGPNLRQSIRGVSASAAAWRPASGRHNIWELTLHAAYWKYAVRRRLLSLPQGSFALKGSNLFAMPKPHTDAAWRDARQLLDDEHRKLMATVADARNSRVVKTQLRMIFGVAYHDIYHAGQIRLLRRLQQKR
ncbi:MAG TPA: DinB family protein [Candidatus Acidoferrales bacterium]